MARRRAQGDAITVGPATIGDKNVGGRWHIAVDTIFYVDIVGVVSGQDAGVEELLPLPAATFHILMALAARTTGTDTG